MWNVFFAANIAVMWDYIVMDYKMMDYINNYSVKVLISIRIGESDQQQTAKWNTVNCSLLFIFDKWLWNAPAVHIKMKKHFFCIFSDNLRCYICITYDTYVFCSVR